MGHTRLGILPKTRKWETVVSYIATSDPSNDLALTDIPAIASATLLATEEGLKDAINDDGLTASFFLLTKILIASRTLNPQTEIEALGIQMKEDSSVFDIISQFQDLIDDSLSMKGVRTDVGEIAQQAAGETLGELLYQSEVSLFGPRCEGILSALKDASTKKGFAHAGRTFFSSFIKRFLNFYLSRATAAYVDSSRLGQIGAVSSFNEALQLHCSQSARIVETFAGDWYSKNKYLGQITPENTERFLAVSLKKLAQELSVQRGQK